MGHLEQVIGDKEPQYGLLHRCTGAKFLGGGRSFLPEFCLSFARILPKYSLLETELSTACIPSFILAFLSLPETLVHFTRAVATLIFKLTSANRRS